jgi:dolichyl-phosphate-mannose-protein mannosyltransferase
MCRGWKHGETSCNPDSSLISSTSWNIERYKPGKDAVLRANSPLFRPKSQLVFSFWHSFFDLNLRNFYQNNALNPDPFKRDLLASGAEEWPFLLSGIRMVSWGDNSVKVFMLGNPALWWTAAVAVIAALLHLIYAQIVKQIYSKSNGIPAAFTASSIVHLRRRDPVINAPAGYIIVLGYLLHYLPFFVMGRVTYLHHYFPALWFSLFAVAFIFEQFIARSRRGGLIAAACYFVLVMVVFFYFSPLTYGFTGPATTMKNRQWLRSWNIY